MIWLDLATDGNQNILELAIIATTPDLTIKAEKVWVIRPDNTSSDTEADAFLNAMPEKVLKLHRDNGLLGQCFGDGPTFSPAVAEQQACQFVSARQGGYDAMHGEGCDYDRAHLRKHMSRLNGLFAWHSFDVATLQVLSIDMCKKPLSHGKSRDRTYRALDDLKRSIGRAREFRLRYMNTYILKAKE